MTSAPSPSNGPTVRWATAVGGVVFVVLTVALVLHTQASTRGVFVYPLDDTYIHMGIARTLVESGTWGAAPGQGASASSSPLYTALLAIGFAIGGARHDLALWLNVVMGLAVVALVAPDHPSQRARTLAVLAVIAATPLPFLAGLGMEHVAQVAITLALVAATDRAAKEPTARWSGALAALAVFGAMVRYEFVFPVVASGAVLLAGGRVRPALAVVAGAASAWGAFALGSLALGAYPVPNSILMKSVIVGGWRAQLLQNLQDGQAVLVLLVALVSLQLARGADPKRDARVWMYTLTIAGHVGAAKFGWMFRYEAYLVAWGGAVLNVIHFWPDDALGAA